MRIHQQLFNRLLLTFKIHTYVIHTYAPFPSVLAVLPHKAKIIQPLLNQLSKKIDFDIIKQLQQYPIEQLDKQITVQSDIITRNSVHGISFDQTTQYIVKKSEKKQLQIVNKLSQDADLFGVILYGPVQKEKVSYFNSSIWYTNEIMLKLTVLAAIWQFFRVIELETRVQNFGKVDKKKK